MNNVTLTLPRPHAMQRTVESASRRFNVLSSGRRWGKTELVKRLLIIPALHGKPVGYFAPTYKLVTEVWSGLTRILSPLTRSRNFTEKRIELVTGGVIEMWTLTDPDAGRSRKYAGVVIDEAGLVPNLVSVFQEAIRPTLMDYAGWAWFSGTPKGHNDFYRLYEMAGNDTRGEWAHWQRPTHDNPYIPRAELEDARADMTDARYRQEILAEFLEDGAGVFRYVRRAVYGDAPALDTLIGRSLAIGIDLAKTGDYTVFATLDLNTGQIVRIDRMQGDYTAQLARLADLCGRIRPLTVVIESNTGQMFIEEARRIGLPVVSFATTAATKQPLIERLALAFEHGDIGLPDDAVLLSELMAYESDRLPGGAVRYSAPEGQHDDCVMAVALAWYARRSVWDLSGYDSVYGSGR